MAILVTKPEERKTVVGRHVVKRLLEQHKEVVSRLILESEQYKELSEARGKAMQRLVEERDKLSRRLMVATILIGGLSVYDVLLTIIWFSSN